MVVTNPAHRKHVEEVWRVPQGLLPDKPGYHAVQQDRMLKDGKLNWYWTQTTNNVQAAARSSNQRCSEPSIWTNSPTCSRRCRGCWMRLRSAQDIQIPACRIQLRSVSRETLRS